MTQTVLELLELRLGDTGYNHAGYCWRLYDFHGKCLIADSDDEAITKGLNENDAVINGVFMTEDNGPRDEEIDEAQLKTDIDNFADIISAANISAFLPEKLSTAKAVITRDGPNQWHLDNYFRGLRLGRKFFNYDKPDFIAAINTYLKTEKIGVNGGTVDARDDYHIDEEKLSL